MTFMNYRKQELTSDDGWISQVCRLTTSAVAPMWLVALNGEHGRTSESRNYSIMGKLPYSWSVSYKSKSLACPTVTTKPLARPTVT